MQAPDKNSRFFPSLVQRYTYPPFCRTLCYSPVTTTRRANNDEGYVIAMHERGNVLRLPFAQFSRTGWPMSSNRNAAGELHSRERSNNAYRTRSADWPENPAGAVRAAERSTIRCPTDFVDYTISRDMAMEKQRGRTQVRSKGEENGPAFVARYFNDSLRRGIEVLSPTRRSRRVSQKDTRSKSQARGFEIFSRDRKTRGGGGCLDGRMHRAGSTDEIVLHYARRKVQSSTCIPVGMHTEALAPPKPTGINSTNWTWFGSWQTSVPYRSSTFLGRGAWISRSIAFSSQTLSRPSATNHEFLFFVFFFSVALEREHDPIRRGTVDGTRAL